MTAESERATVEALARQVVAEVSPAELPLFRATADRYFADPDGTLAVRGRPDEPLGFGAETVVALVGPFALDLVRRVVGRLVERLGDAVADAVAERVLRRTGAGSGGVASAGSASGSSGTGAGGGDSPAASGPLTFEPRRGSAPVGRRPDDARWFVRVSTARRGHAGRSARASPRRCRPERAACR